MYLVTLSYTQMDSLPIELVTIIATDTFELFTTLLRVNTIGQRLCAEYPQLIAKERFIRSYITKSGTIHTVLNNKLHSFNDNPSCMHLNGDLAWFKYGKRHRGNDFPAYTKVIGFKSWFWNGERHREDNLPAIEYSSGKKVWYNHGTRYNEQTV